MQNGSGRYPRVLSGWQRNLRLYVVRRGTELVCGSSAFQSEPPAAADFPLIRAGLRMMWLRALAAAGVESVAATSGLGHRFICHIGDMAEYPFYHPHAYKKELELCAAWLRQDTEPVLYDVGANDGFFSSQIAQMMADRPIRIYAVEPVPTTFAKLTKSVRRLGLEDRIEPIAAAVVDDFRLVRVGYSPGRSLLSRVVARQDARARAGGQTALCAGISLDGLRSSVERHPSLVKIDVEGSEAAVLRGAENLLSGPDRPAMMIEYSPFTLKESGEEPGAIVELLGGYELRYVDDHYGQKIPFGAPVADVEAIQWTCNLFAVPRTEGATQRWASASEEARRRAGRS